MDQSMEELKFIGFSGILSQSFKSIFNSKKLFTQITLTLILPLTLIFLAHIHISNLLFTKIETSPFQLFTGAFDSYQSYYTSAATTDDWRDYFLIKFITVAAVTVLSIISTASVVYTIVCVFTGRDVTFRKSMKVVLKIWKRLTVTLLWTFLILFSYSLTASVVIFVLNSVLGLPMNSNLFTILYAVVYIYGFLYLIIVWQLASVVSVLEPSYGIRAMIKSTDLINGKKRTAITTSYVLYQFLACALYVYMTFVLYNKASLNPTWRVVIGIVCGILLVVLFLIIIVAQTVLYLVCKSYHRETIDVLSLSTYLSSYLNDSRPVFRTGEDIQLGRSQNQLALQV